MKVKITNDDLERYFQVCQYQKNLVEKTLRAYRADLRQFQEFTRTFEDIGDKKCLNAFIQYLHANFQPRTVQRKIASLHAFFNYMVFEEYWEYNPLLRIQIKFKQPKLLPKTIPLSQLNAFFKRIYALEEQATTSFQEYCTTMDIAIFELLIGTGLRVSELCSIQLANIDLQGKTIKIYGKGSKERVLQIGSEQVYHAFMKYYALRMKLENASPYLFINKLGNRLSEQSVRNRLRKLVELSSQKVTPHMFRHTFATLLLEEDVDIRYIQKILGHSSISTTQIYTHISSTKQSEILNHKNPRNFIDARK